MNESGFAHEHKFDVSRREAETFFAQVAPHVGLEVYDDARPIAYTRTTYLDTDDLEYLKTSRAPVQRRVRVREYAAAADLQEAPVLTGAAYLELKATQGQARTKARLSAPPEVVAQLLQGAPVDGRFCQSLAALAADPQLLARLAAGALRPRVTTFYRRASLLGDGGRVRITFDEGLAYAAPPAPGAPGTVAEPTHVFGQGPARVVEVKHAGAPPSWIADAMAGLREASGLSKYFLAMNAASSPAASRKTMPIAIPAGRLRNP